MHVKQSYSEQQRELHVVVKAVTPPTKPPGFDRDEVEAGSPIFDRDQVAAGSQHVGRGQVEAVACSGAAKMQ